MLGIYYTNQWNAKSLPFMSTRLKTADGDPYPLTSVFTGGILDKAALAENGLPRLTGSFVYAMFMANAAIGALIAHTILFWGKDIIATVKNARKGIFNDRHHAHMTKNYKEAPWWWYALILLGSFILGLVVVIKENITLPIWAYVVALIIGSVIAPFVSLITSSDHALLLTCIVRAPSSTRVTATVLPPTTCPRCWQVL